MSTGYISLLTINTYGNAETAGSVASHSSSSKVACAGGETAGSVASSSTGSSSCGASFSAIA